MKAALIGVGLASAMAAFVAPTIASADGEPARDASLRAQKQDRAPRAVVVRGAHGEKKIIFKDPVDIIGTHHRPSAAFYIHRSSVDYAWAQPEQKLVKRILPTVRRSPF